jgi:hypothetical protein
VLGGLGADGAARLGPVRPLATPGPDLGVPAAALAGVVAAGFGLDHEQVTAILASGPRAGSLAPSVTASQLPAQLGALTADDFAATRAALAARVSSLAAQAAQLAGGKGR